MGNAAPSALVGREKQLAWIEHLQRDQRRGGTGCAWITGEAGCGKSQFLDACAEQAERAGWEVLRGGCTDATRTDPYGPFLAVLGLCFDKAGRLINDRSVYSIVDQISLDDVFDAVADIPGMSVVAFGIKVGMSIFETRRSPRAQDELLNRNFEFILQVLRQIDSKRKKPVFLAIDDMHLASATTYALLEYLFTRIQDTRLLVVATWEAGSAEDGARRIREVSPKLARPDHIVHLQPLAKSQMQMLLGRLSKRPLPEALALALIEFSQGKPEVLVESLRLVELEGERAFEGSSELDATSLDALVGTLVERQLAQLSSTERALLECASLIGSKVPLDVLTALPLSTYLGCSERALLSTVVGLADDGRLLAWDGESSVRFASPFVHRYLREESRQPVVRRDHLRVAEAWRAATGELHPAQLAAHYVAGGDPGRALEFALQNAQELMRSAAYPEAVQSYELALNILSQLPEDDAWLETRYDVLQATGLAAEQAGDWERSLACLQEALALGERDASRQAEIHASLGWLHFQRGEIHAALEALDRSAALYRSLGDVQGQAQAEYYLGVVYSSQKEWQRAVTCFEHYLDTAAASGFEQGRASALVELGNLHRLQRHWAEAEEYLRQGIGLAEAEEDYAVLAQGYNYLGSCYAWQGKPESIQMLHRALDIVSERTKQPAQEARIQNTLAETLVRMNRWAEAEAAFHSSAAIKERLGDRTGLAITYGGLGRLYLRQWRFDQAVAYLQKDIDLLAEEFDVNVAWIQQWTNMISEALRLQGQRDEAQERLSEALLLAERIPDQGVREQSQAYTHMLLARLALDRTELGVAARECAAALSVLADTWAEGEIQRTLARLARKQGDLARAGAHLDRAVAAVERGEDIDRGAVFLEQARYYRDRGDIDLMRERAAQVVHVARRLQNAELERRASELLAEA